MNESPCYGRLQRTSDMKQRSIRLTSWRDNRSQHILVIGMLMATVTWMALIMVIMAWPNLRAPSLGPEEVQSGSNAILVHILLFSVLGVLISSTFYVGRGARQKALGVLAAAMIGLAWGIATEWYQLYVPGRYASLQDMSWNMVGSAIGGLLTLRVMLWRTAAKHRDN